MAVNTCEGGKFDQFATGNSKGVKTSVQIIES